MKEEKSIITPELLESKGWVKKENMFNEPEYQLLWSQGKKGWSIILSWDMSNTPDRDWGLSVHIDNSSYETVGHYLASGDCGTTEQFNKFMDALDIDYRL